MKNYFKDWSQLNVLCMMEIFEIVNILLMR